MCAGIRDAANLAWKLTMVLRNQAPASLLDTYESERAPHVRAFIDLAMRLGDVIQTTDPVVAAERDRKFAAGKPEIFEFPAPGLGPGLRTDAGFPAGQPFPQPTLADGRLLDAVTGARFVVLGAPDLLTSADDATRARLSHVEAVLVDDTSPAVRNWLAAHDAKAVVLRPDHYILGIARDAVELAEVSARLPLAG